MEFRKSLTICDCRTGKLEIYEILSMGFWIFMFIATLLIPVALLLTWYECSKLKKINNVSGYRTSMSMKNQDTWDFAQKYCAKLSLYLFFPSLILSIVSMPFSMNKSTAIIGTMGLIVTLIQMMSFAVIIIYTEKALKKNFDKNGNRY